jgi:hypothetical protein
MRKLMMAFILVALSFAGAHAQTGNNQVGIGAEVGIPTGDFGDAFNPGFGASVKGLYGVGSAGQVTLTLGYTIFKEKEESGVNLKASILPIMAGYRHNFSGLYLEPQIGYGSYGLHAKYMGESESESEGGFTWAAGLGYAMNGLDISARYQSGKLEDADSPFSLVGIRIGYNFSLSK